MNTGQNARLFYKNGSSYSDLILSDDVIVNSSIVSLRQLLSKQKACDFMKSRIRERRRCLKSRVYAGTARKKYNRTISDLTAEKENLEAEKRRHP